MYGSTLVLSEQIGALYRRPVFVCQNVAAFVGIFVRRGHVLSIGVLTQGISEQRDRSLFVTK